MRFNRIKYKNYRCFLDVELTFETQKDRNISMIVAPNGGGKTEMLFSFWWVLYDFKFETLKGKGYTPYALNSTLYQDLANGKPGSQCSCSVEVEFEDDNYKYVITRTEKYVKNTSITKQQDLVLAMTNLLTGAKLLPIKDPNDVENALLRVLPQNILGGIIFDGERMKKLSQIDDDAKKAVEGVIKQITNEELFERCKIEFQQLHKEINKTIKAKGKGLSKYNLDDITDEINRLEKLISTNEKKIGILKIQKGQVENKIQELEDAIAQIAEVQKINDKIIELEKSLSKLTKQLEKKTNDFRDELQTGSLLATGYLVQDVRDSLDKKDIPAGLTADAVRSILGRSTCICGCDMKDHMRKALEDLIVSLPPDNINSTIQEMANSIENSAQKAKRALEKSYEDLQDIEREISQHKTDIANLKSQIINGDSQEAARLQQELDRARTKLAGIIGEIERLDIENSQANDRLKELYKIRGEATQNSGELEILHKKDDFILKCIEALSTIHEENKMKSLRIINGKLNEAYQSLSEDTGRKLYIVQYDERKKYRLLSYFESKFKKRLTAIYNDGTAFKDKARLHTKELIEESVILQVAENSSTGQSKINSLAFAKSILDYSSQQRDSESTELSRDYPFLIDSPFTELSDDNLVKSAMHIHKFASQIILMISKESLSGIQDHLLPYIGSKSELAKSDDESYSYKVKI